MSKIEQLVKKHEGFSSNLYQCPAGKWTIGYGRNLEDRGLSHDEANFLLKSDICIAEESLSRNVSGFDQLSSVRKGVLVDMFFNMGWPRLSTFKRFLKYLELKKYAEASEEMLDSRWARQVTQRAKELSNMMKTDQWPEGL